LERDHGHLKQRLAPTRGFKRLASADAFCWGHALIRNLRNGFSALTHAVPCALRPRRRIREADLPGCPLTCNKTGSHTGEGDDVARPAETGEERAGARGEGVAAGAAAETLPVGRGTAVLIRRRALATRAGGHPHSFATPADPALRG
jgi:hypothetical protein